MKHSIKWSLDDYDVPGISDYFHDNLPTGKRLYKYDDIDISIDAESGYAIEDIRLNLYTNPDSPFGSKTNRWSNMDLDEPVLEVSFWVADYYTVSGDGFDIIVTLVKTVQPEPMAYTEDLTGISSDVVDTDNVMATAQIALEAEQTEFKEFNLGNIELITDVGTETVTSLKRKKTGTIKLSDHIDPTATELNVKATAVRNRRYSELQIDENLENITIDKDGYHHELGRDDYWTNPVTITLTPEPDYVFSSVEVKILSKNKQATFATYEFEDIRELEVLSFDTDDFYLFDESYYEYTVQINAKAEKALESYDYTETLKNAKSNTKLSYVTELSEITYTAIEDNELTEVSVTTNEGNGDTFTYTPDKHPDKFTDKAESFTFKAIDYIDDSLTSVHVSAVAKTIEKFVLWAEDLENVTVKAGNKELVNGDFERITVDISDNLIIKAVEGLVFNDPITFDIRMKEPPNDTIKYYPEEDSHFNDTKTAFIMPISEIYDDNINSINLSAKASERKVDNGIVTSFTNVYTVNATVLDKLSRERFGNIKDGEPIDYGDYIYNLYTTAISLPSELISEEEDNIILGHRKTTTEANIVLGSKVLFDLGTIEVRGEYGNVYDYRETQALLHVPYATQPINIELEYVMDAVISLTLALDLYNGTGTLNVYSSKLENGLVSRNDIQLTHEVPFMRAGRDTVQRDIGRYIHNDVETSYIELKRSIPYDANAFFGKASNDFALIGDFSGYLEVRDVNLDTRATTTEEAEIERRLIQGIVINQDETDLTE